MKFWDTSAIVPLIVSEHQSDAMRARFTADPTIVVWWATRVEVASAISRREHAGVISSGDATTLLRTLDALALTWLEVQPVAAIRPLARRLLRTHPLRAADALQLAAAVAFADGRPESVSFVCLDERLSSAAQREGLSLVDADQR
ncbi:MAG: type II toxin-antitoxin system VapC family toxin [Ardenticatenales bacterium]